MHRILAADIGGTNSRFAAFETDSGGRLSLRQSCWLPTEKADSFTHLIEQLHGEDFELPQLCFAAVSLRGCLYCRRACRKITATGNSCRVQGLFQEFGHNGR